MFLHAHVNPLIGPFLMMHGLLRWRMGTSYTVASRLQRDFQFVDLWTGRSSQTGTNTTSKNKIRRGTWILSDNKSTVLLCEASNHSNTVFISIFVDDCRSGSDATCCVHRYDKQSGKNIDGFCLRFQQVDVLVQFRESLFKNLEKRAEDVQEWSQMATKQTLKVQS